MKISVKIILFIEFLLYISFLYMDVAGFMPYLSSVLKYCGILLCIFLVVSSRNSWHSKADGTSTLTALILTGISDIFLLFTRNYIAIGIGIFCLAHIAWMHRYKSGIKLPIIIWIIAVFISIFQYLMGNIMFSISTLVLIYTIFIIFVTYLALKSNLPHVSKRFAMFGMILFLLCDINVFLFNIVSYGSKIYEISAILMWLFYLPSQVLLALSAINISKLSKVSSI